MAGRARRRPRRVFVGLNEVAGYLSRLTDALRVLGVDARLFDIGGNPMRYGSTSGRLPTWLLQSSQAPAKSWRRRVWVAASTLNQVRKAILSALLLVWAPLRYDAFILEGRDLFFSGRGLWLLRVLGKRLVVVFTGSDHRPPYLNGRWMGDATILGYRRVASAARKTKARVERAERYANAIVALETSAQFHSIQFVDFLAIGIPFVPPTASAEVGFADDRPEATQAIRILHCPTHPLGKGTSRIRQAVDTLMARGMAIDYREMTGRPNREVLAAIRWSDFVVDQLYSDTPMAGFATEAAYFGKPTVVGSYAEGVLRERHGGSLPPTALCHPDEIDATIEHLCRDVHARRELGQQARRFVLTEWSPRAVAMRYMRLLDGDPAMAWLRRPEDVTYIYGWGLERDVLRTGLRAFLNEESPRALTLDHHPDLRRRLIDFAAGAGT